MTVRLPLRAAALLVSALLLAACAGGRDLGAQRAELGDFRLAHNIVVDDNAQRGPLSRPAEPGEWKAALEAEITRRLGRYEGDRLYHVAVHVDAYILAVPGVPVVASPRSALIISVNLWDDALGRPLNERTRQFTVLESLSGESVVGSGLTQDAAQQMANLVQNAALTIENWLAENPQWFDPEMDERPAAPEASEGA